MDSNIVGGRRIVRANPGGVSARSGGAAPAGQGTPDALRASSGPLGNTGLLNFAFGSEISHREAVKGLSRFDVLYAGVDTVHWSYKVSPELLQSMLDVLEQLVGQGEIDDDGRRFIVSRVKTPYRYRLQLVDGFTLVFPDPRFSNMPVRVEAGARACLACGDGLEAVAVELLVWWLALPVEAVRAGLCLSRVDPCTDILMADRALQHMCRLVGANSRLMVTRAVNKRPHMQEGRYTGFEAWTEAIHLRLYNKYTEAVAGGDWDLWSRVYGRGESYAVPAGRVPVRVEWQLRRDYLRQLCIHPGGHPDGGECAGIRSLAEFKRAAPLVLGYLMGAWFRFAAPAAGHAHKRELLPAWAAITRCVEQWRPFEVAPELRKRVRTHVPADLGRLTAMGAGCMSSIAAKLAHDEGESRPWSLEQAMLYVLAQVECDEERRGRWESSCKQRFEAMPYAGKQWRLLPVVGVAHGATV